MLDIAERESATLVSKVKVIQKVIASLMPLTASVPNIVPNDGYRPDISWRIYESTPKYQKVLADVTNDLLALQFCCPS